MMKRSNVKVKRRAAVAALGIHMDTALMSLCVMLWGVNARIQGQLWPRLFSPNNIMLQVHTLYHLQ